MSLSGTTEVKTIIVSVLRKWYKRAKVVEYKITD